MSDKPIKALAAYLSGPRVATASIGLQLGGHSRKDAEAFFALRNAFGVSGYMNADEAESAVRNHLKATGGE